MVDPHPIECYPAEVKTSNVQADIVLAPVDFVNPTHAGGSFLNRVVTGEPKGEPKGEPLNVIISALSSPKVLTDAGFLNYAQSIGFSGEFLGIHRGTPQTANLGDGHGWVNETIEMREDFGDTTFGTLEEVVVGGNHFRMYRQNGPTANTGALFLAVSQEKTVFEEHNIVDDGYNIGRDRLVASAIHDSKFKGVKLVATAVGDTSFGGVHYTTTLKRFTDLLAPGKLNVNHDISTDGATALLTVKIK